MGDPIKENIWDRDGQYSKGKDAAALVLTSAYGVLNRKELQTDIIIEAQKKARKMKPREAQEQPKRPQNIF